MRQNTQLVSLRLCATLLACAWLTNSLSLAAPTGNADAMFQASSNRVRTEMLVSADWLSKHLTDDGVVVLHVAREKSHYDAGHIPGSRFLPWNELVVTRDGVANELPPVEQLRSLFTRLGIGNKARVVLYGDNLLLSATRAYFTLDYLGQGHRTAILDGGLEKWKADGRETSKEGVIPVSTEFVASARPEVVAGIEKTRQFSAVQAAKPQDLSLVDCRSEEQFLGEPSSTPGQRSGHIPGAVNLYWARQVVSRENPVLLPATELQSLFEAAGVAQGNKVVTYCNSGVQASHAYFVAKYLGYDASMYDGSFSEWIKAENTKVVTGKQPK